MKHKKNSVAWNIFQKLSPATGEAFAHLARASDASEMKFQLEQHL